MTRKTLTNTASILDMPNPHFEDDALTSQGVIKIECHGLFMDGMNPKRDERAPRAWQFARIADLQR